MYDSVLADAACCAATVRTVQYSTCKTHQNTQVQLLLVRVVIGFGSVSTDVIRFIIYIYLFTVSCYSTFTNI